MEPRCPRCQSTAPRLVAGVCPRCLISDSLRPADAPGGPSRRGLMQIPGHTVVEELARGGMGVVYRATQADPPREVALKMLRPQSLESPEMLERFRQEARTLAALEHPAILPVYDTGEEDGLPWFTMKLATGGTLAGRRDRYRGDWRGIAQLVATLADAVQFAHDRGVLHRDIKPGNVLFDDAGRAHVADFGLARAVAVDSDLTRTIALLGTPHYLAPEIAVSDARAATTSSDQYALGAVLYELLAGRPPFEAEGIPGLLRRIAENEPVAPSRAGGNGPGGSVPRDLEVICLKALSKSADRRYASVRDLASDLRNWLEGHPITARAAGPVERLTACARRNPALAFAASAAVLLLAALVAIEVRGNRRLMAAGRRLRANLYAADMALAATALDRDDLDAARRLLALHRPAAGEPDPRGIEWRVLARTALGDSPRAFSGHSETVVAVSPSPDGRTVLSAGWDGTLREWDFADGRERRSWGPTNGHRWFAFARQPSGRVAVAIDAVNPGALVVDLRDGSFRTVDAPRSQFLAFTPDGQGLLTQSVPRFWSVDGSLELRDLGFGSPRVLADTGRRAAFSPDGSTLATGAFGDRVRVWSWPSMRMEAELGPVAPVVALGFSPDGRHLVSAGFNGDLKVWDVAARRLRASVTAHGGTTVGAAAFSPDGKQIATAGGDHVIRLWDAATLALRQALRGHADQVWALAWHPDGRHLLSTTRGDGVRVWPLDDERRQRAERVFHDRFLEFTPDGRGLLAEEVGGAGVVLIDSTEFREISRNTNAVHALGIAADHVSLQVIDPAVRILSRLALPSLEAVPGSAVVLDTNGLPATRPMWLRHEPGSGIFAAHFPNGIIRVWDASNGRALPPPEHASACDCDFWLLPGSRLALVRDGFAVEIFDARSGRTLARLEGHRSPPSAVDVSPDGTLLATSDEGGGLILWDAATYERRRVLNEFDLIGRIRFSGDGRTLVVADYRRLQFLNLETLRVAGSVPVDSLTHTTLAVAPGDASVALLGRNNRLRVWPAPRVEP